MRKIRLSDTDGALFDEEMIPNDYEYLARHKATFCRMWTEQGQKFWRRYVEVFRSYILRYSLLGDLMCDTTQLQGTLEFAFVVITTHFIEGKVNQAKSFLNQIAELGKNRHRFVYLDSKSVIKDPFYTKETRDIFREFFGPASEKSSYIKVYLLTPIYMKFGGSIIRCLIKWMEAEEINPEDDSYYVPPTPIEINVPLCTRHARSALSSAPANVLCAYHLSDCKTRFYEQFVKGVPTTPINLSFWEKKDPRFCEPENPLWNPGTNCNSDWRDGLTIEKFQEFYTWCSFNDAIVKPENQCQDCHTCKKTKKKKKKKKKKTARSLVDFGYDDVSIAVDSEGAWNGSSEGVKSKLVAVAKVCEAGRGCKHDRSDSTSDDDWLDSEEPLTQPLRLISQKNKNSPLTDSGCQTTIDVFDPGDALVAQMELETQQLEGKLDRIYLETQIAMFCNGGVDCQCPICVVSQNFSSFDLDDDSDTVSEMAESADGKLREKESAMAELARSGVLAQEGGKHTSRQKVLFGKNTVIKKRREAMKLPVAGGIDLQAHFDVQHRSHPDHGASEKSVTLMDVNYMLGMHKSDLDFIKSEGPLMLGKGAIPRLTPQYLSQTIKGLPLTFYAEGDNWCITEVDYRKKEEGTGNEKSTHFILKISNTASTNITRALIIELLRYVVRRKKRPSAGWIMSEEDIFAFLHTLGLDNFQVKGVTFTITTGAAAIDVMTLEEIQMVMSTKPVMTILTSSTTTALSGPSATKTNLSDHTYSKAIPAGDTASQPSTSKTKKKKKNKKKNKGWVGNGEDGAESSSGNNQTSMDAAEPLPSKQAADSEVTSEIKPLNRQTDGDAAETNAAEISTGGKQTEEGLTSAETTTDNKQSADCVDAALIDDQDKDGMETAETAPGNNRAGADPDPADTTSSNSHTKEGVDYVKTAPGNNQSGADLDARETRNTHKVADCVTETTPSDRHTEEKTDEKEQNTGNSDKAEVISQNPCVDQAQSPVTSVAPVTTAEGSELISGGGDAGQTCSDSRSFSICSNCGIREPALRSFKKCQRCKEQKVVNARYYCGRPCQQAHWKILHSREHAQGTLQ